MTLYHIANDGKPATCKAQPGNCPLDGKHFSSKDAAEFYVEGLKTAERDGTTVLYGEEGHRLITRLRREEKKQEQAVQTATAKARAEADPKVSPWEVLSEREHARRLALTTESVVDSDYDGSRRQREIFDRMKAAGYVSGDYTWSHDYLKTAWSQRPAGYISSPGYLQMAEQMGEPQERVLPPHANAEFTERFQAHFAEEVTSAVDGLTQLTHGASARGVKEERRIKNKLAAVRQFREVWGPRFAQVESELELRKLADEFKRANTPADDTQWQNAGWNEGVKLMQDYVGRYLS